MAINQLRNAGRYTLSLSLSLQIRVHESCICPYSIIARGENLSYIPVRSSESTLYIRRHTNYQMTLLDTILHGSYFPFGWQITDADPYFVYSNRLTRVFPIFRLCHASKLSSYYSIWHFVSFFLARTHMELWYSIATKLPLEDCFFFLLVYQLTR